MSDRMKTYKTHPMSLVFNILTKIAVVLTISVFVLIVGYVVIKGVPYLKPSLFAKTYTTENVSMLPAIVNTFEMLLVSLAIAAPLGIFCAIYLVEYAKKGNKFVRVIRLTTETLSGIPSIVYGLFGNMFFVLALNWKLSMLSGACTLAIMVLPLIIRSTEEALKSVDDSFREGSYGLGAGKLRTIFVIVLPPAISGILSGVILAMGRIFGETRRPYLYRRNYRQVCRPYRLRTYPFYPYVFTFKRGTLYERSKCHRRRTAGSSPAS